MVVYLGFTIFIKEKIVIGIKFYLMHTTRGTVNLLYLACLIFGEL